MQVHTESNFGFSREPKLFIKHLVSIAVFAKVTFSLFLSQTHYHVGLKMCFVVTVNASAMQHSVSMHCSQYCKGHSDWYDSCPRTKGCKAFHQILATRVRTTMPPKKTERSHKRWNIIQEKFSDK